VQALAWLGLSHVAKGEFATAVTVLEQCAALSQRATVPTALLGEGYATLGDRNRAQAVLQELLGRSHVSAYFTARIYAALGENDEAFKWLKSGYEEHAEWMTLLKVDPRFDDLRPDPRMVDLMRRMNFPA
jgi:tetratricopeptide (TPR) repeat protein